MTSPPRLLRIVSSDFLALRLFCFNIRQHDRQILYVKLHVNGRKCHYRKPQVVHRWCKWSRNFFNSVLRIANNTYKEFFQTSRRIPQSNLRKWNNFLDFSSSIDYWVSQTKLKKSNVNKFEHRNVIVVFQIENSTWFTLKCGQPTCPFRASNSLYINKNAKIFRSYYFNIVCIKIHVHRKRLLLAWNDFWNNCGIIF